MRHYHLRRTVARCAHQTRERTVAARAHPGGRFWRLLCADGQVGGEKRPGVGGRGGVGGHYVIALDSGGLVRGGPSRPQVRNFDDTCAVDHVDEHVGGF